MGRPTNELPDAFLRLAVHDLRGPLTAITVNLELLLADLGPPSASQLESVEGIRGAVAQMDELIAKLLEYDRVISQPGVRTERCELNAIVGQVAQDVRATATAARHTFVVATAAEPLPLRGDPLLLRELVANLVSNALKFTPPGGRIEVHTTRLADQAVLGVRDSGPGIPAAERERVFEPFVRLAGAQTVPGSGLGLHLVRVIAERHGGQVTLDAAAGGGCLFTVRLPLG